FRLARKFARRTRRPTPTFRPRYRQRRLSALEPRRIAEPCDRVRPCRRLRATGRLEDRFHGLRRKWSIPRNKSEPLRPRPAPREFLPEVGCEPAHDWRALHGPYIRH